MKRSLSALCIATCAWMLTGCAWLSRPGPVQPLQANLLAPCAEHLSPHEGTTGADALRTLTRWPAEYRECATRHNALVEALKKAPQ